MDVGDSAKGPLAPPSTLPVKGTADRPSGVVRDEVAILQDAAAGERAAVRILMEIHMPTVYGFVFGRLGGGRQAVDDIMQETLIEAIRSADSFRGESSLATWLCAIARRRLYRFYEAERKQEEAGRWLTPVPSVDPEAEIDRRDAVTRALGSLLPTHRQVLVMKYIDELSVEAIAEHLGKKPVQVQSLLQRARDNLKAVIQRADR